MKIKINSHPGRVPETGEASMGSTEHPTSNKEFPISNEINSQFI
jgi:hypothetical protein